MYLWPEPKDALLMKSLLSIWGCFGEKFFRKFSGIFSKNTCEGFHFPIQNADCMPKTFIKINSYIGIFQGVCNNLQKLLLLF